VISSPRANIAFSGTGNSVSGNGKSATSAGGIRLTDPASTDALSLRNVAMNGNLGDCVFVQGTSTSTFDLGTATAAGNNTFSNVDRTALYVANQPGTTTVSAVGNTWVPNVQGADGPATSRRIRPSAARKATRTSTRTTSGARERACS
jgi:hypothetical protein